MESNTDMLIRLIKENPELPVVPIVDGEIVGDDSYQYWLGHFGRSEVKGYYLGREKFHFDDDDEEDVLGDLAGCKYYRDYEGRDITELSDEEWDKLYKSIPWIKAIVVYITT